MTRGLRVNERLIAIAAAASLLGSLGIFAARANAASSAPGYQVLRMEAGTWEADLPVTTGGRVQHLKAVQKNTLLGKGMWMINDLYMPMSNQHAPRYHGHGVWTYNPATKRYEGTWVDQKFAAMRHDTGTYDTSTSTLYWYGEQPDYKGHTVHWRFEEHFSGSKRELRFYTIGWRTGKQHYCGTLTFQRRAGSDKVNEDDTSTLP